MSSQLCGVMKNLLFLFVHIFVPLVVLGSPLRETKELNHIEEFKTEDPQEIVVDEVVGQMLVLLALPIYETLYQLPALYYCLLSFLLFRLFDIWKPFPVSYFDNNIKGALGIMLDDIAASFYAIIILILILFFLGG